MAEDLSKRRITITVEVKKCHIFRKGKGLDNTDMACHSPNQNPAQFKDTLLFLSGLVPGGI